jgi:hypothetical protein
MRLSCKIITVPWFPPKVCSLARCPLTRTLLSIRYSNTGGAGVVEANNFGDLWPTNAELIASARGMAKNARLLVFELHHVIIGSESFDQNILGKVEQHFQRYKLRVMVVGQYENAIHVRRARVQPLLVRVWIAITSKDEYDAAREAVQHLALGDSYIPVARYWYPPPKTVEPAVTATEATS